MSESLPIQPRDHAAMLAVLSHRMGALEADVAEIKQDGKQTNATLHKLSESVAVLAAKAEDDDPPARPSPPASAAAVTAGGAVGGGSLVALWEVAKRVLGLEG